MSKIEINEDAVRKLSKLLEESGLSEIEYEQEGHKIRVAKIQNVVAAAAPAAAVMPQAAAAAAAPGGGDEVPAGAVVSPMVGTAYVAADPSSPPFVKVGDGVQEGQTLLIIEAMKVMNPLPSPRAGKVAAIFVNNGDPVEFGEPLLVIE